MITTFYGEDSTPSGAAVAAHRRFDAWQRDQDIEILQVATTGCSVGDRIGFWLTVHWRWNEDPQRWSGGGDLAEALARHDLAEQGASVDDPQLDYEGSKRC